MRRRKCWGRNCGDEEGPKEELWGAGRAKGGSVGRRKCIGGSAGEEAWGGGRGEGRSAGGGIVGMRKGQRRKCGEEEVLERERERGSVGRIYY